MAIWIAISLWWVLLGFPPSVTELWPSCCWPPPCCFFYYFPFPHCPSWKHRKIATFVQFCPGFGCRLFLSYCRRINQQKAILWPNHRTENMGLESELCNKTQNNSEKISSENPTFLKFLHGQVLVFWLFSTNLFFTIQKFPCLQVGCRDSWFLKTWPFWKCWW